MGTQKYGSGTIMVPFAIIVFSKSTKRMESSLALVNQYKALAQLFAHTTSLRYHSDMTQNLPLCYSYTSRAAHHTLRPASRTTLRSLSQSASREPPSLARTLSQLIGFRGWFGRQECHAVQTAHLKSSEFSEIVQNH